MNVASPVRLRPSTHFSPAQQTFTISRRGGVWHVTDEQASVGGFFVTLEAALTFVRRELAVGASAHTIIVGSAAA